MDSKECAGYGKGPGPETLRPRTVRTATSLLLLRTASGIVAVSCGRASNGGNKGRGGLGPGVGGCLSVVGWMGGAGVSAA